MRLFSLHSAHLLLSSVATCCLLLSLIVLRRKNIAMASKATSRASKPSMSLWALIFRLLAAPWTGFAAAWAKRGRTTATSAELIEHHGD
jgi:hypothetical protein